MAELKLITGLTYYCIPCRKYFFSSAGVGSPCPDCNKPGQRYVSRYQKCPPPDPYSQKQLPFGTDTPHSDTHRSLVSGRPIGQALIEWDHEMYAYEH